MAEPHERECSVCTNDFTTPKILPCGHLLCRECVISWLDTKPEAGCPLCRCPIVEQFKRCSADTVDALPTDFVMEALVESARVLSKHHVCCVCDDVKADFICIQCQDMLCLACTKIHKKLSATRSHDVESLSTVTPERLAASRPALCADHGDKQAEFFCGNHRLAVCSACKSKNHKVCPKANILYDEIESAQNSLRDLTKILVEGEQKLEQAIGQLTSRLQKVDVSEQEDMAQVDKTCDRLQKLVEDFRKKLKEMTRISYLKIRKSLHDVKSDLSNRLGKMTSHKHIVTRATAVSPRPALLHLRQTLTDRVNNLDLRVDMKEQVLVKPSSSVDCETVVVRIEKELLVFEAQKTTKDECLVRDFPILVRPGPKSGKGGGADTDECLVRDFPILVRPIPKSGKGAGADTSGHPLVLHPQPPVLVFHENCCPNIRLTNFNTTAEKIDPTNKSSDGMVVSRDVMMTNILYEVRVDVVSSTNNRLFVGVTNLRPAYLNMTNYTGGQENYVMIFPTVVNHRGKYASNTLGDRLKRLLVGSRVGLLVDSSNDLHLYVDGQDQGVAVKQVKQPCFAVFGIWFKVTKVTAVSRSMRT